MSLRTLALVLSLTPAALAQSPMFRGNPARTGVYPAPARPLEGRVAWRFEVLTDALYNTLEGMDAGPAHATTPAVVGDRIYVAAGPFLCALDLEGHLVFRAKLGGNSLSSPAVAGDTVFLPADDNRLYAVNARDGVLRWAVPLGAPTMLKLTDAWDVFQSSPLVADGRVYVGSADGQVVALDAATGAVRWRFQTGHVVRSSPALADGRLFVGSFDGRVYAFEAATGKLLWARTTQEPGVPWQAVQATPAVAGGLVWIGSRSTFTYGLDPATGTVRWRHPHKGSWAPSSAAVAGGLAFVGQSDGKTLSALDAQGQAKWTLRTPGATFASPALAGDTVYAATNDNYNLAAKGHLLAVEAASGKVRWDVELPASAWSSPVVAGDTVYIGCANGWIYAVR